MKIKCCVCKEEMDFDRAYSYMRQTEDLTYLYDGHKGCLGLVESLLAKGEDLNCTSFDKHK